MITSLISFFKRIRSLSAIDPERDWIMLLIISILMLAAIVVWNAFVFDTVATGGVIGAPTATAPPVFSQSSLDAIHTVFANRAAEEAKYITDVYHYADPSL
jgi:hypothetical protein